MCNYINNPNLSTIVQEKIRNLNLFKLVPKQFIGKCCTVCAMIFF